MLTDVYLFTGIVALGAVVICVTVWRLERWLLRQDKPRVRRALRVRKVRRPRYEPPMPKWEREFPDGRKEASL